MDRTKKVGVILIATGAKYHRYIIPLIASIKENFKPTDNVEVFLFTDAKYKYTDKQFYCKDLGYPGSTLWRFKTMLSQEKELKKMDYLYYMDIDMLVVDKIGEEILSNLVATEHPGFVNRRGTFEDRPKSLACVKNNEGGKYFCGGFNGGSLEEYLKMVKKLSENIQVDHNNGIMAIWHDESHLNRYMIDNPPTKVLHPGYCYPEPPTDEGYEKDIWKQKFQPKIHALDKSMRERRVSIVIPCYEQAHFLHKAIESALAQTYANTEIIVVDDGSPDNTAEVARRYPVTLIRQTNKGLSAARNTGIDKATGYYFLPLDADDTVDKNYLLKTVPGMTDSDVGVVYTAMHTIDEKYKTINECMMPSSEVKLENLKHNNQLYVCSLIRMETLKESGCYNTNMIHGYEDWNLWIDIAKRDWKFKFVPLPLFNYMVKTKSMAVTSFYEWHKWNLKKIRENHPSLYKDDPPIEEDPPKNEQGI